MARETNSIMDLTARSIACEWHGGQWSPLYALCSSGAIVEGVEAEITECLQSVADDDTEFSEARLVALLGYVQEHGIRGPVFKWAEYNRL